MINRTNLLNSFYGQTSLNETIFSVLTSGVKLFRLVRNALMDSYIFYIWYKLFYFSLPSNPAIHRMGNALNILCPRCKEQKELQSYLIFYCKLSKVTLWDIISELINLKYAFNIPFKITLKTIIMGTSSQFHDGVQLKILPTLSSEILLLNWAQKKPLWRPGATF